MTCTEDGVDKLSVMPSTTNRNEDHAIDLEQPPLQAPQVHPSTDVKDGRFGVPRWQLFVCISCATVTAITIAGLLLVLEPHQCDVASCAEDQYCDGTSCQVKLPAYSLSDADVKCQSALRHCGRCANETSRLGCPSDQVCVEAKCKNQDTVSNRSNLVQSQTSSEFHRMQASFALREAIVLQDLMNQLDLNNNHHLEESEFCLDVLPKMFSSQTDQDDMLLHMTFRSVDNDSSNSISLEELFVFAEGRFQVFQWYFSLFRASGGFRIKPSFMPLNVPHNLATNAKAMNLNITPEGKPMNSSSRYGLGAPSLNQTLESVESIIEAKVNGTWFQERHPDLKEFAKFQLRVLAAARNHTASGRKLNIWDDIFAEFFGEAEGAWDDSKGFFGDLKEDVVEGIDDATDWINGAWEDSSNWVNGAWEDHILPFLNGIMDFFDDLFSHGVCGRKPANNPKSSYFKPLPGHFASDYVAVVKPPGVQNWGRWATSWAKCEGKINGFHQRVEPDQGWGDDTSLNAVRFVCDSGESIASREAHWGSWSSTKMCPDNTHVTGFWIRSEENQGWGDDTAANSIHPFCSDGTKLLPDREGGWGDWYKAECPSGFYAKGFKTQVEGKQGGGDDSALNSIALLCFFDYGSERLEQLKDMRRLPQQTLFPQSGHLPFTIAVAGDPQLGYDSPLVGSHSKDANIQYRDIIDAQAPDGIILVGDMTHGADKEEVCDFDDVWHSVKTWPTTGNHDWMHDDSMFCGSDVACYSKKFLNGDDFLQERGEFRKWWMKRLLTDSGLVWENFGGADSWSIDSLAYSFVKEGVRFVLLNEHPEATNKYMTEGMQFLKEVLMKTSQPAVLVMHFPASGTMNGCESKYAWCSKASEERLAMLLSNSQVVGIVAGHHHDWSGIWDWELDTGEFVTNFWGNRIKMMQAGSPVAEFGRRWLKIASSKCSMTLSIMEGDTQASTCRKNGAKNVSPDSIVPGYGCEVEHVVPVCGSEAPKMLCVDVLLVTAAWGSENKWELKGSSRENGSTEKTCSQDFGHCGSNTMCAKRCCFPHTVMDSLDLTLFDSYGDAWHGGYLYINGHPFTLALPDTHSTHFSNVRVVTCATVEVYAEAWPMEMSWTIGDCSGSVTQLGKNEWMCCRKVGLVVVSLHDSYGDGWHGGRLTVTDTTTSSLLIGTFGTSFLSGHQESHLINWS